MFYSIFFYQELLTSFPVTSKSIFSKVIGNLEPSMCTYNQELLFPVYIYQY